MLVAQKDAQIDEPGLDDLYLLGTIANIKQMLKLPGGTIRVLVEGLSRARINEFVETEPFIKVEVEEIEEDEFKDTEREALIRSVLVQFEQYIKLSKKISPEILSTVSEIEEPGRLADLVASHLTLKIEQKQGILEAVTPKRRLEYLAEILS
jgi:ATP-dependent Lon protease